MSTGTKTEINKLIARCRRVKWDVRPTSDGGAFRVTNDTGRTTVIHGTYSTAAGPKLTEQNLVDMGLVDREKELAAEHEAKKKATLTAQRRKAEADGKRLAAQAALTVRAAGPYAGPEAVPLDWFLADHPAPWVRWVIIDPPLAAALLKRNIDNRPMYPLTVAYYRDLILAGRMRLTHQGMAMDTRGVLQDGQHRLQACVDADQPIRTAFTVGLDPGNFATIDEGRNRSIADILSKDGVTDRNLAGTTIRLVAAYREPFPRAFLKVKTPNEVLYAAFKGDPDRLTDAVKFGHRNYKQAKVVSSALSAATYLLREANGHDNSFVRAFLNGLVTSVKGDSRQLLDTDDPRLLLRNDLERRRDGGHRMRGVDQLGYVLLAWNLIVDPGQAGRRIKWKEYVEDIPQIVLCKDRGRSASTAPDMLRGEF